MVTFLEKNKGIQFKVNGSINMVPSKDFPLSLKRKKDIKIFTSESTEEVTDSKVIEIFNNFKFTTGHCFNNARELKSFLDGNQIYGWDFISGWLFLPEGYPIFHAWLAKGNHVLDYTNSIMDIKLLEEVGKAKTIEEKREILAMAMVEKDRLPSSETKVCGKAHKEHVYIGSIDSYENAIQTFKMFSKQHISYIEDGMSMKGLSKTQLIIEKIKNEE